MSGSVRLRQWQHAALTQFLSAERPDFLAVATPGAGKTTFALTAVRMALATQSRRVVVVTPTSHLKTQWATAAARLQLHLDPGWSAADGALPADMHGIVTTYQQVALNPGAMRRLAREAFVVLDEVHHGGEERAWGQALAEAFGEAGRRLSLSGTPFRSDTRAIPFVRYEADEAVPDFEYTYGDALRDGGVVRPIYFPAVGGEMEWSAPDGSLYAASFDDPLTTALANQRLRTALSLESEWLPSVLRDAVDRLKAIRRAQQPNAGGLVIAADQEHARGIADLLSWRFHVAASVVTSDDPTASERISAFAAGSSEWLVAVRMVSEGVDIPRLRVGVFATATTTDLFFRQAVGRFVRWVAGVRDQRAWLYVPDDARLRAWASTIAQQRRHSLVRDPSRLDTRAADFEAARLREADLDGSAQLSLFAPLSAVATETAAMSPWHEPLPTEWSEVDTGIDVELAPPPVVATLLDGLEAGPTRRETKDALRLANAAAARELARRANASHAVINGELNRLTGVRRITEATVPQLKARLEHAERWLARLH